MKLEIGPSIDNNRVRLDFRKSPDKPKSAPSYSIEKSKADEFVKKYNTQEQNLSNLMKSTVGVFTLAGILTIIKKRSLKWVAIAVGASTMLGVSTGIIISAHKKNSLMDKYNVKPYYNIK